jgi:hypothetical protein
MVWRVLGERFVEVTRLSSNSAACEQPGAANNRIRSDKFRGWRMKSQTTTSAIDNRLDQSGTAKGFGNVLRGKPAA